MPTPQISKITLPSGQTYFIKDAEARSQIQALVGGDAVVFMGVSSTAITDGGTQSPTISGETVTPATGQLFFYGTEQFIWGPDGAWHGLGSLDSLGALAYKDDASGSYTPEGTVSQPTFSGTSSNVTITATDNTNGNYQPKGTVSKPNFTGSSSTFTGTYTPAGTVSVQAGGFESKNYKVSPATVVNEGNGPVNSVNGNYIPRGDVSKPTFTGSAFNSTGKFTPTGSVNLTTTNKTATVSTTTGTATYTPEGTVTQPTFSGNSLTSTGKFTPAGSIGFTNTNKIATVSKAVSGTATYTPEGSVAAPTISVKTAGTTATVKNPTSVTVAKTVVAAAPGTTAPSNNLTYYSVTDETLSLYQIGYTTGASITTADVTVKTGDAAYEATAPTFTGTGARLVTDNISVPSSATFTGTEGNLSVSGTPSGTVSQPTFTGTGARLVTGNIAVPTSAMFTGTEDDVTVSGTATGSVSKPVFTGVGEELQTELITTHTSYTGTFTGTEATISTSGTPNGSVSQPTFTGTKAQLSGTTTASGTVSQPTFTGTQKTVTVS